MGQIFGRRSIEDELKVLQEKIKKEERNIKFWKSFQDIVKISPYLAIIILPTIFILFCIFLSSIYYLVIVFFVLLGILILTCRKPCMEDIENEILKAEDRLRELRHENRRILNNAKETETYNSVSKLLNEYGNETEDLVYEMDGASNSFANTPSELKQVLVEKDIERKVSYGSHTKKHSQD